MTSIPASAGINTLGPIASTVRKLLQNRNVVIGGALVLIYVLAALFGPLLWTVDPYAQILTARLAPPVWQEGGSWTAPLGTDHLGRDVLARLMHGTRISLGIGFAAAAIGAVIGVGLGAWAGYKGGHIDRFVTFVLSCKLALPNLLIAMSLTFLIRPSIGTVIVVIGLLHWSYYLVVVRASAMRIRELDFVRASRVAGANSSQIIAWDVLPNLAGAVLVIFTLEVAGAILAESALSFLGVGIPSPTPSWGTMIAEGRSVMLLRPWLIILPGLALFFLTIGVNMLGDGLRDVLQPQSRS